MPEVDYECYWRDLCELLDQIELAFDAGDQDKIDRLLKSRFDIARMHGMTVTVIEN